MWQLIKRDPPKPENFGKLANGVWHFACAVQHPVHGVLFLWRSHRGAPLSQRENGWGALAPVHEISEQEMLSLIALAEETASHEARLEAAAKLVPLLERRDD